MDLFNPSLIKKYERILKKNPYSKCFCPLAQIYRSRKELKKAQAICERGMKNNPSYLAGFIVQSQIYKDQKQFEKALNTLDRAKAISPDNVQMHQLYGEIYMEQGNIVETLNAYKVVLSYNPDNSFAQKVVSQLEDALSNQLTARKNTKTPAPRVKKIRKLENLITHIEK